MRGRKIRLFLVAGLAAVMLQAPLSHIAAQPQTTDSSSEYADFCVWGRVGIKKSFSEHLALRSHLEFRTKNNSTTFDLARFTIELSYKFSKYFSLAAAFVPSVTNTGNGTAATQLRYYVNATGSLPVGNWNFSLRERFQQTFLMGAEVSIKKGNPATLLRSRPQITYKVPGTILQPTASVEVAVRLFDPAGKIMDHIRYTAGITFALNAHNSIFPYYRYYQRFGSTLPDRHIVGFKYYYSW